MCTRAHQLLLGGSSGLFEGSAAAMLCQVVYDAAEARALTSESGEEEDESMLLAGTALRMLTYADVC